jgi:hypothetical protein
LRIGRKEEPRFEGTWAESYNGNSRKTKDQASLDVCKCRVSEKVDLAGTRGLEREQKTKEHMGRKYGKVESLGVHSSI